MTLTHEAGISFSLSSLPVRGLVPFTVYACERGQRRTLTVQAGSRRDVERLLERWNKPGHSYTLSAR